MAPVITIKRRWKGVTPLEGGDAAGRGRCGSGPVWSQVPGLWHRRLRSDRAARAGCGRKRKWREWAKWPAATRRVGWLRR